MKHKKDILLGLGYFSGAAIFSSIFISQKYWLYSSVNAMILSGCIAGGKWLVQIIAALVFLREKTWEFIRRIGLVCLIGSAVLFVYYIFDFLPLPVGGFSRFVLSIGVSVLVMIIMYYRAVQKTALTITWFLLWMACLAVAVFLQAKVVF